MGIDSSNLEELLVEDVMNERQALADRGYPNQEPSHNDTKTSLLIDLMAKN